MLSECEYSRMAEAELTHWWYRSLHALVFDQLGRFDLPSEFEIIDAGCGTGGLLLRLRAAGLRARGFDLSPHAVERSQKRGVPVELCSISELERCLSPRSISVFICNDVLYHLADEERIETLKSWHRLLVGRGKVILNVPTGDQFKGIHDLSFNIGERIALSRLESELVEAGYELLSWRYWPLLLSPPILLCRLWQRRLLARGQAPIRSDNDLPPALLNRLFYTLTRVEHRLPIGYFGSSLFVVAQASE